MDGLGERLDATGHGPGEAVYGRPFLEHLDEFLGVKRGHRRGVQGSDSRPNLLGTGKRRLHGHLLVKQHAGEERKGVIAEQFVGVGVPGDVQFHAFHPATCPGPRHG